MEQFLNKLAAEFTLPLHEQILIFTFILAIIFVVPILLKRLRLPGMIGLILTGVAIGPNALNIVAVDNAITLFSTIGLLYIMFIAGLELDLNQFKINRNNSIIFGILTYVFPLGVIFPICYFFLDYSPLVSFLIGSMFATHTLIAYPVVSKLGIAKDKSVAVTVGGTIIVDTLVLIILAVVLGIHTGSLNAAFWLQLAVSLFAFTAVMFAIIPRVAQWFFDFCVKEKHFQYIFVLFMVFLSAFLAELAGLEAIVGAFFAGLALNRLIPSSSVLMNRIEFIGNALFIPFFLIYVGMLVNLKVVFSGYETIVAAIIMTLTAIFGKFLATRVSQKLFKYSATQRNLMFGLSTARVAATLAVVLVAYKAGLVTESILNATVIVILATCIVAGIVTERAAKALARELDKKNGDEAHDAADEHILLPIANVENIGKLFEFSLLLKAPTSRNPITVLTVVPNNDEAENNIMRNRKKLQEYIHQAKASEIDVNYVATIDQNVSNGVNRISREIMADLIVLGWPRPGIIEKILGEKWANVVSNSSKTIFVSAFNGSLHAHKRVILITPQYIESSAGFVFMMQKVAKIAAEWSLPIVHYGSEGTKAEIDALIAKKSISASVTHEIFQDWEDFLVLARHINKEDLIVFVSSRKGTVSYEPYLDSIPVKLEKYFELNNKILIFPAQNVEAVHYNPWENS